MIVDIRMLAIFMGISNVLQVTALFIQHRLNRTQHGTAWWILGTACWALGYAFNFLAYVPGFRLIASLANNIFLFTGLVFLYIGTLRFFSKREPRGRLIIFWVAFSLISFYFTFFVDDPMLRWIIVSIGLAAISMLIAQRIHIQNERAAVGPENLLAILFRINAIFFCVTTVAVFVCGQPGELISAPLQTAMYLNALVLSPLWTFGFIILVNQRMTAESNERFEQIFKTGPEAVVLTRVSDGAIVDCNERFTTLSGYSRSEALGQADNALHIWKNPDDREKLFSILKEKGFCEEFNSGFSRKDGTVLDGLISARIIPLQGESHIVSVIRNVTERKHYDERIQQLVHQLQIEKNYAQDSALTDNLTLLINRGHFDEVLSTEFYRLKRSGAPLSLIMLDVDHFKKYNDRYGHLAGDDCLRKVAAALKALIRRKPDVVARYGGEEFAVILPETDWQGAVALAESIRKTIFELAIPHLDSEFDGYLTISVGVVSTFTIGLAAPEEVIEMADGALYLAKQNGRNRFEIAKEEKYPNEEHVDLVRLMWRVSAESGNETIDSQHKNLFAASNKLLSAIIDNKSKEVCDGMIGELLAEVVEHFQTEEAIFRKAGYPLAEDHCLNHAELVAKAVALADKYKQDELVVGELFGFLAYEVIAKHMFVEDRKFFPYLHRQTNHGAGGDA